MIAAWLAGKASGIIIFCIACLSIILLPAVVIQTVRINGISVFGWYAVQGYKPLYEKLLLDNSTLLGNQAALQNGLKTCNTSVDSIAAAGKTLTAAAQTLVDAAKQNAVQLQGNIKAVQAIKSTDEKCPVADSIMEIGTK